MLRDIHMTCKWASTYYPYILEKIVAHAEVENLIGVLFDTRFTLPNPNLKVAIVYAIKQNLMITFYSRGVASLDDEYVPEVAWLDDK